MNRKNQIQIVLMSAFVCSLIAMATPARAENAANLIADCWTESGYDVEDGEFAVSLETKSISKANLVSVLNALSGVNIQPMGYPLIFGDQMFVYVRAVDFANPQMDRGSLKAKVRTELEAIVAMSRGISASCNFRSYPAPAVGVRN